MHVCFTQSTHLSSLANQLVADYTQHKIFLPLDMQQELALFAHQFFHRILQYTHRIQDTSLREWLKYGIAIHTAGLCFQINNPSQLAPQDRNLVETLFENGLIQVVCTTSTLALGVNLPVYLVIIKGTVQWKGGGRGYEEIDNAMLQQMVLNYCRMNRV